MLFVPAAIRQLHYNITLHQAMLAIENNSPPKKREPPPNNKTFKTIPIRSIWPKSWNTNININDKIEENRIFHLQKIHFTHCEINLQREKFPNRNPCKHLNKKYNRKKCVIESQCRKFRKQQKKPHQHQ